MNFLTRTSLQFSLLAAFSAPAVAQIHHTLHNNHKATTATNTAAITMRTQVDNAFLCPNKKEIYLYIDLKGAANGKRLPMNLSVVFDRSGSMAGERIEEGKEGLNYLIDQLTNQDVFSLVTFDHAVQVLHDAQPVYDHNALKNKVNAIQLGGSTNISDGVQKGYAEVEKGYDPNKINRVLLLTDGKPTAGISDKTQLETIVRNKSHVHNIALSTFGLGHEYNEFLLHGMADAGSGHFYHIDQPSDVQRDFGQELNMLASVTARNADVLVSFPAELRAVQVFGLHGVINNNEVHINLAEVHPNEQQGILIKFEVLKQVASYNFKTTLSYDDATSNQHHSEKMYSSVAFSDNPNSCDQNVNAEVHDKIILYNANTLLNQAMHDAEHNNTPAAKTKIAQSKQLLQSAKNPNTVKDQLSVVNSYDQHLNNWTSKSHHDKSQVHKSTLEKNYNIQTGSTK